MKVIRQHVMHLAKNHATRKAQRITLAACLALPAFASAGMQTDRIIGLGLVELRAALDKGALTSADVVQAYLTRIRSSDLAEGGTHAVLALNEQALQQAKAWDKQRAQQPRGHVSQPLAGIPFLVKDNINAAGVATTGGSLALANSHPSSNAFAVQKVLEQGGILLGKTNLSELAASYGTHGYSSTGGQTINPFNRLRSADGSSSGSAAAVASKLAPYALGTDTVSSIRSPASVTGTVGMRSTMGLVSRSGVIPSSLTADVVGAITRTVEDQALVLDAIQGEDKQDASTRDVARPNSSFVQGLAGSTFANKVIAVVDNFDGANADVDAIKENAASAMERAGARVVHIRLPKKFETLQGDVLAPIALAEFKPQFDAYLAGLPQGNPQNMSDFMKRLGELTANGTRVINSGRYKGLTENFQTLETDSPVYIRLLSVVIPALRSELAAIMNEGKFDALVFPTIACTAPVLKGQSDSSFSCKNYAYAAAKISSATGFPDISVPAGVASDKVPVGMSFLGRTGDDGALLKLAAAFERLEISQPVVRRPQ